MDMNTSELFGALQAQARAAAAREPLLATLLHRTVLNAVDFGDCIALMLASHLSTEHLPAEAFHELIRECHHAQPTAVDMATADLLAVFDRDAATTNFLSVAINQKGFQALQAYRVGHILWQSGRSHLASFIQGRVSQVFAIDIHPACVIGSGIMLDHGTGVVIGETCLIEDDVSILQNVTLGGTGKCSGKRHPTVRSGVMIGAGASILGNIEIGAGAKIGAGSVVLAPVPPYTTVVGVPARVAGQSRVISLAHPTPANAGMPG